MKKEFDIYDKIDKGVYDVTPIKPGYVYCVNGHKSNIINVPEYCPECRVILKAVRKQEILAHENKMKLYSRAKGAKFDLFVHDVLKYCKIPGRFDLFYFIYPYCDNMRDVVNKLSQLVRLSII